MSSENENDKQPPAESLDNTPESASSEPPAGDKPVKKPVPKKPEKKAVPKASKAEGAESSTAEGETAEPVKAKEEVAEAKSEDKVAAAKAEAPVKKEAPPPPPPPEPGQYGQLLIANGFHPTALGNDAGGIEMMELKPEELREACLFLRDNGGSQFDLLVSVSGVDWKDRLEAVYHLYSTRNFKFVELKATAVENKLPSVEPVWQTADWHERETYDLFGIVFEGHPNLQRILMPADWIGYPLRKDYKVEDPRLVWNER